MTGKGEGRKETKLTNGQNKITQKESLEESTESVPQDRTDFCRTQRFVSYSDGG